MVGQKALRAMIASMETLPRAMLLLGPKGCGKRELAKEISSSRGLPFREMTDGISDEALEEAIEDPFPAIRFVALSELGEREQNVLLKFVEEPPAGSTIILSARNAEDVLPTLAGRCVSFRFTPYTKDEMSAFVPNAEASEWVSTPGMAMAIDWKTVEPMKETCAKIVSDMPRANLPNALSLSGRLNLDGKSFSKFDPSLFAGMLASFLLKAYAGGNAKAGKMLKAFSGKARFLGRKGLSMASWADSAFLALWEASR